MSFTKYKKNCIYHSLITWMKEYRLVNGQSVFCGSFHDFLVFVLCFISVFILILLIVIGKTCLVQNVHLENSVLEYYWTILPLLIICLLFYPSYFLLAINRNKGKLLKKYFIEGFSWAWRFVYDEYDYVSTYDEKPKNRVLQRSAPLFISSKNSWLDITSSDVIHRFSLPELNIKVDACPGRLASVLVDGSIQGLFVGQCSEICGAFHSYMPINCFIF